MAGHKIGFFFASYTEQPMRPWKIKTYPISLFDTADFCRRCYRHHHGHYHPCVAIMIITRVLFAITMIISIPLIIKAIVVSSSSSSNTIIIIIIIIIITNCAIFVIIIMIPSSSHLECGHGCYHHHCSHHCGRHHHHHHCYR